MRRPLEYEKFFGKVVTKKGEVIKLAKGELTDDKDHFKVESVAGNKFIIPIEGGARTVNCVQRTYKPTEDSPYEKLFVYNLSM